MSKTRRSLEASAFAALDAVRARLLSVPPQIGRYRIVSRLGEGGMGKVYLARDPELDRPVAVKVLSSELASDHARARLVREARVLAAIAHPNVVDIFEVGRDRDGPFIAMEFLEATTLDAHADRRGEDWQSVLRTCVAAGRGLAAAHARGIVHRDFKPSNVLVTTTGQVKVVDFGLATTGVDCLSTHDVPPPEDDASSSSSSRLTQTGSVLGTPRFMAPEQHLGLTADAASDQFSFCLSTWDALFGDSPFAEKNARVLLRNPHFEIRAPRASPVPRRVAKALVRGMAFERDDRWPTMDALLAELESSLRPRRWRGLALGLSTAVAVVAVTWTVTALGAVTGPGTPPEDAPPRIASGPVAGGDASALMLSAKALVRDADFAAAEATLRECHDVAVRERDDTVARDAANALAALLIVELDRPDEGMQWYRHAVAAAQRLGEADLPARERLKLARVHARSGDRVTARGILEGIIAEIEDRPLRERDAEDELALGLAYHHHGELDQAAAAFDRALGELQGRAGMERARVRALLYHAILNEAQGRQDRVRELVSAAEGEAGPLAPADPLRGLLAGLAGVQAAAQGRHEDALPHLERAYEVFRTAYGEMHHRTLETRLNLANEYAMTEHVERMRELLDGALTEVVATWGAEHRWVGEVQVQLGVLAEVEGRLHEALGHYGAASTRLDAHPEAMISGHLARVMAKLGLDEAATMIGDQIRGEILHGGGSLELHLQQLQAVLPAYDRLGRGDDVRAFIQAHQPP